MEANIKKKAGRKKKKKWSEMTLEEKRAILPERLNKLGQWLLTEEASEGILVVKDMRAVLK